MSHDEAWSGARKERMKQVTKVVFLLNTTKVGDHVFWGAKNLISIYLPGGISSIGDCSFLGCNSLKVVTFPKSLTIIGRFSFQYCSSLESVDLFQTKVQELGVNAFHQCTSLKSMKIPDSLQKLGNHVFYRSLKLVPSEIRTSDNNAVVAYLRSIQ